MFTIPEDSVASTCGIPRKDIAALRGPKGERWSHGPRGAILWSENGVAALQGELRRENPPLPVQLPADGVSMTVLRRVPNPRVVEAILAENGARVTVYLGHNGNNTAFRPGEKIVGRYYRGAVYLYEGRVG